MSMRHVTFVVLGVAAFFLTWPHAIDWMSDGGNILDPVDFFGDAIDAGGTAAFLSIDMLVAWIAFMFWVVGDAGRLGMGYRTGWFFVALSYVGVSLAFPIYLVVRERFVERQRQLGTSRPTEPATTS